MNEAMSKNFVLVKYYVNHSNFGDTQFKIVPVEDVFIRPGTIDPEPAQTIAAIIDSRVYLAFVVLVSPVKETLEYVLKAFETEKKCLTRQCPQSSTQHKFPPNEKQLRSITPCGKDDEVFTCSLSTVKEDEEKESIGDTTEERLLASSKENTPKKRYGKEKLKKNLKTSLYVKCLLKRYKQSLTSNKQVNLMDSP